jgi:hypothetical protein
MLFNKDFNTTINYLTMTRDEFLDSYRYLSGIEYDIYDDMFYTDLVNNVVELYKELQNQPKRLKEFYNTILYQFVNTLSEVKQKQIKIKCKKLIL